MVCKKNHVVHFCTIKKMCKEYHYSTPLTILLLIMIPIVGIGGAIYIGWY